MQLKRVGALVACCGLLSGLAAIGTYLASDYTPFGGDTIDLDSKYLRPVPDLGRSLIPILGRRLALTPDILANFLLTRLPALLAQAVLIALCVATRRRRLALAASLGVPLLYELLLAVRSFDGSWLGMLWALALHWPERPEYIVPLDFALRVSAAYLTPVLASGLAAWLLVLRFTREQTPRGPSALTPATV